MSSKIQKWVDLIKEDMINLFFEKMLSECDNSLFEMEKRIKDYALSGIQFVNFGAELDELEREIISLEDQIELKDSKIKRLKIQRDEIQKNYDRFRSSTLKWKKEMNTYVKNLKKNSVVFSMDDI